MLIQQITNNYQQGIIFIPGFLGQPTDFSTIISKLNLPISIYNVDLFSDYSILKKVDYQDLLNSLEQKIREIPIQQKILVGYSLGARLALGLYLKNPSEYAGLFLESVNPGITNYLEREKRLLADQQLAEKISQSGLLAFLRAWYQNPIFDLNPKEQALIVKEKSQLDPIMIAKALPELSLGAMPSYWDNLNTIACPVTLINGAKDSKFLEIAKEVTKIVAEAKQIIVPSAGHNTHLQNPSFYAEKLGKFIKALC